MHLDAMNEVAFDDLRDGTVASWGLARVSPDLGAVADGANLIQIIGALLTYALIFAVVMLVVCAATWAVASSSGSWQVASKARIGVGAALGGAVLVGAAPSLANWLIQVGASL